MSRSANLESREFVGLEHAALNDASSGASTTDWTREISGLDPNAPDVFVELHASEISVGRFAARTDCTLKDAAFSKLKRDIAVTGGNSVPITVRALPQPFPGGFEVITGHRRFRACQQLGLPVRAILCARRDADAIRDMIVENRSRKSLSPLETGRLFKMALEQKVWASAREAAAYVGLGHSQVSKVVKLASLPQEIVDAFVSPMQIQTNWGKRLTEAYTRDPHGVVNRALEIRRDRDVTKPADVLEALATHAHPGGHHAPRVVRIEMHGQLKAEIAIDVRSKTAPIVMRVFERGLDAQKLEAYVRRLLCNEIQLVA